MPAENSAQKQQRRGKPFRKGVSGNPAGKPKGTRNKATALLEAIAEEDLRAIVGKIVERAKGGDLIAAKLIFDRVAPARKTRPVVLDLPVMKTAADLPAAIGAVARAMACGELSPDEGQAVASVLEAQRRAIETTELDLRLRAIEEKIVDR